MEAVSERQGAEATREKHGGAELLLFRLGNDGCGGPSELFAIAMSCVREIVEMPALTASAGTVPPLLGRVRLRGDIIHVFDLPAITGCVPADLGIMLVMESGGAAQGFAVESVERIVGAHTESVAPSGHRTNMFACRLAHVDGLDGEPLTAQLLDAGALFERVTA